MKKSTKIILITSVSILLIAVCAVCAVLLLGEKEEQKKDTKQVRIVYKNDDLNEAQLEQAREVFETRLQNNGVEDYEIDVDADNGTVAIDFAYDEHKDPIKLADNLILYGTIEFKDENGNLVMDTSSVKKAVAKSEAEIEGAYLIQLELTSEGSKLFADITQANIGKVIYIYSGEQLLSAPIIQETITSGNVTITGCFTKEEAQEFAAKIDAGGMPYEFELESFDIIR